jgi:3-deoxy-manno-octulosonate cytidylyltransferase (CMP-KDO synthetase)
MWAWRRAQESGVFSAVVVATDDERIRDTVIRRGGQATMTSAEHQSGTDRVHEAFQALNADYVVNLQGDEPLVPLQLLRDFVIRLVTVDDNTLLTCVTNVTMEEMADPNIVKAVCAADGRALYFSRSPIPYMGRGETRTGWRHIGIYGFSRKSLDAFCSMPPGVLERIEKLEQLRALEGGMRIICMPSEYQGVGIDTPADLDAFRRLVADWGVRPKVVSDE